MSILEARGISFSYPNGVAVLSDIDFSCEAGERVALHAPSGYGKSTFCQILAGYLVPAKGEVLLDGVVPRAYRGAPNPVQLIWQHPEQVMDPYVRISSSLAEAGDMPFHLLRELGVREEWMARFPHELSGGQLQRCCIARALACNPKFLIADEISTMLDAITQAQIWDFLLDYCDAHDVGLVLVTHSQALQKRLATRVIEL